MGIPELMDGLGLIALLVGLYAFSEIFVIVSESLKAKYVFDSENLKLKISFSEFKKIFRPATYSSIIGVIIGMIPGLTGRTSSWLSYSFAKKTSKTPEEFGNGSSEGIAASESSNNATVGGSMIPLLSLGIPGSPGMAIIMGAFIIHGIRPGPNLFSSDTNLVYGIFYGFLFTSIALFIVAKMAGPIFSRVLTIPNTVLVPIIIVVSIIGTYTSRYAHFDLWIALVIGIISYFLIKLDFSVPAFVLAFILGPIIEESLRRSLLLSDGSFTIFVSRPLSLILLSGIVVIVLFAFFGKYFKPKAKASAQ